LTILEQAQNQPAWYTAGPATTCSSNCDKLKGVTKTFESVIAMNLNVMENKSISLVQRSKQGVKGVVGGYQGRRYAHGAIDKARVVSEHSAVGLKGRT
jgi:hypothetical protein